MTRYKSNPLSVALALFALYTVVYAQLAVRQNSRACVPNRVIGAIGASNGGRKIGIVIDESASMEDNDPSNIRINAAKALNDALVSLTEVTGGKKNDVVTVAGFHSAPDLLYPLGDPIGAVPIINAISSSKSGTFIGGGVDTAVDELSKAGTGSTANRTGIVVLTDGQDNTSGLFGVQGTINAITRAGNLGIRVSFGFLSVDSSSQNANILNAILQTGGAFTSFSSATSQESFIAQVILQGLTGIDASSDSTTLFPGLTTSARLSQTESNKFTYSAQAGEVFNFTITAIDSLSLRATLRDTKKKVEVDSASTNSTGIAVIKHTAQEDLELELEVSATGVNKTGTFSVGLQSSLGPCVNTNTTTTTNTTEPTTTSTSPPVQFTGGATPSKMTSTNGNSVMIIGLAFILAALTL